jgi:hypothetical protein
MAEPPTEEAEGTWTVVESLGGLHGCDILSVICSKGLVLTLTRVLWFEEEALRLLVRYRM